MTPERSVRPPEDNDSLSAAVRQRQARRDHWRRHGERPLGANIAMMGAFGWLVVLPALGGAVLGRSLDRAIGTGPLFAAAGLMAGLAAGCALAWKRMHAS